MKKIEMGKKYELHQKYSASPISGNLRWVDGKNVDMPVAWESDCGDVYYFDAYGESDIFTLVEISPYADIPIDTPGWARMGGIWWRSYFAGSVDGAPMVWRDGTTSFSSCGERDYCDEFVVTKPEGNV